MSNYITFRTFNALAEVEALRADWEQWQNHANTDIDQFLLICRLRPEVESPFVIALEQNNQLVALLLARIEFTQFAPKLGYITPVSVPTKKIVVLHQGLLGQWSEEISIKTVECLWATLKSGVADAIEFQYLPENSIFLATLLSNCHWLWCEKKFLWSLRWEMNIPKSGDFLQDKVSSKQRWKIRKRKRDLESAFPGTISWKWMNHFEDISGLCDRIETLASCTYQRGLGVGFFNNDEYRQRLTLFSKKNQLRVQLLEIEGNVRAFWIGFVFKDAFYSSSTGYDPNLREYEPGTLIFVNMVDELAREGVGKLDFGIGDAIYKERFGDSVLREGAIWLFAPTTKGLFLRLMLRLISFLDSTLRQVFIKLGVLDILKSMWRKKLTKVEN